MSKPEVSIKLSVSGEAQVKSALLDVEQQLNRLSGAISRAGHYGLGFLGLTQGIGPAARAMLGAADAVTTLNNQLRLATGSTQAATQAYNALFDIAQRSRVSFTELGSTFASISRAGQALGLSQERLLGVTEALGNALTISGGSAEGMKAALVQLGQGLASGTLRGEELNSVMEQTPRLAKALADGLGVSIGKLREMGAAGQLTGEQVIKALESQSQVLSGEVQGAVLTVGQAFTQLQNASIKAAGDMDRATGATSALASGLQGLSGMVQTVGEAFKNNEAAIQTTLGLLAGAAVAAGLARTATALGTVAGGVGAVSTSVTVLKGVVASLNPATLALLGLGAAVGYANSQAGNLDNLKAKLQELQAYGNAAGEFGQATPETKAQTAARLAEIERLKAAIKAYGEEAAQANFLAIGGNAERALREANAKAAASYDDLRLRLSGFKGDYEKYAADLARIQAGMASGDISQKQGIAWLTDLALKHGEVGKAAKGAESQAKAAADAELAWRRSYTLDLIKGWDDEAQARARAATAAEAYLASTEQALIDAARKSADSVAAKLQSLKDEETALAIAAEQNISLAQAIEEVEIARLREQQAALMREGGRDSEVLAIQSEIDARKKLKDAIGSKEARDASTKAAKEAADAWQKTAAKIEDSLTDALMRGFESGKDFAANLRDTVVNMFKTLVLRPVVQVTVQGGLNAVGLGGQDTGSSLLGTASNAYGAYNAITGMGGIASSAGIISGATYGTTALSSQSMMLAAQEAGFGAAGVGAAGNIGAVLSNPATIALGGALAISSIHKATKGESRWGGQYGYNFGDGLINNRRGTAVENAVLGVNRLEGVNTLAEAEVQAAITGTVGSINALLKSAGSSATLVGFQAGLETSGKGRGGVFAGGTLSTGARFGESGQGDNYAGTLFEKTSTQSPDAETALKNFALDLQQVTIQALQAATDIPEALKKLVQGVDAENLTAEAAAALLNTVQAQISAVEQLNTAFASIGWETLTRGAYDATVALAEASGGFDALSQNLVGYYQNFYTEAEQQARATETLTTQLAALGQTLPATREGFRALVESAQAAGDTALLAGLLALQDEFAALVPAAEDAAAAAAKAAEDMQRAFDTLLSSARDSLASVADAESAVADLELQARIDQANAANEAARAMGDAAQSLRAYVQGQVATPQQQFADVLRLAMQGDATAMQALPSAATAAADAARASASTAAEAARARASILASVNAAADLAQSRSGLVPVPTAESPMEAALRELTQAIDAMAADVSSAIRYDLINKLGEIDTSGNLAIELDEFHTAFGGMASEATLAKVFATLDADGDGVISRLEAIKGNTATMAADMYAAYRAATGQTITPPAGGGGSSSTGSSGGGSSSTGSSGGGSSSTGSSGGGSSSTGSSGGGSSATPSIESTLSALANGTAHQKAAWYAQMRSFGYSDAQIKAAVDEVGYQPESDWANLKRLAGYSAGGYTGHGGQYEPAGIVHAGEVVWSQADVARWGGWRNVDAMRTAAPLTPAMPDWAQYGRQADDALVAEIKALRAEVQGLRAEARATAINTGRSQDLLKRVTRNGEAMQTEATT